MRLLLYVSSPHRDLESLSKDEREQLSASLSLLKKHASGGRSSRVHHTRPSNTPLQCKTTSNVREETDGSQDSVWYTKEGRFKKLAHHLSTDSGYASVSDVELKTEHIANDSNGTSYHYANCLVFPQTIAEESDSDLTPGPLQNQLEDSSLVVSQVDMGMSSEHDGIKMTRSSADERSGSNCLCFPTSEEQEDVFAKSFDEEMLKLTVTSGGQTTAGSTVIAGYVEDCSSHSSMSHTNHVVTTAPHDLTQSELELAETDEELVYLKELKRKYESEFKDNMEFREIMRSLGRAPSITDYMTFKIKLIRDKYGKDYETPISHAMSVLMEDSEKSGSMSYAAFTSAVDPLVSNAQNVSDLPFLMGVLGGYMGELLPQFGDAVLSYSSRFLGERMAGGVAKFVGASVLPTDCPDMDNIIDVLTSEDHATAINEMKDDMTDAHIKVVMPTVWESPPEANKGPTLVETPLEAHKGPPVRETPQEVHSMDNSSSKWLSVSVLTMATHIASFLGQLQ